MFDLSRPLYMEPATRFFDPECENGFLYLYDDLLLFWPDGDPKGDRILRFERWDVETVSPWKKMVIVKNGIRILCTNGAKEYFIVWTDRNEWADRIAKHLRVPRSKWLKEKEEEKYPWDMYPD